MKSFLLCIALGCASLTGCAVSSASESSESSATVPNPVASKDAVVESGNMRFTVLTPEMIRIEYSPAGKFEDRATFSVINRDTPTPEYKVTTEGDWIAHMNVVGVGSPQAARDRQALV